MQRRRLEAGGGWQGGHGLRPEQAFERALGMGHGLSPLLEAAGVADELAVAHAEAGLEQRVDLGHRQPLFEGFGDLRRERRIGHPALAPPRSFAARSLCHRPLSGHQL